jgi:hypothetical protein
MSCGVSLLLSGEYLDWFITENANRLADAQKFTRAWFEARGMMVLDSNAGHFVWVDIGSRKGWSTLAEEQEAFQKCLDGGVYVVSRKQRLRDDDD